MLGCVDAFDAQGPLLFAHRGASLEHTENTLPAFRAGLAAGADVLELDVHMSADGHVIVSHDATGKRVFGIDQAVSTTRFSQIKRWSVKAHSGEICCPATLPELFEAFPHVALNIDVKQHGPDMIPVLLDCIVGHAAEDRVLLTSFSLRVLRRIREFGYRGPLGVSRIEAAMLLLGPLALAVRVRRGAARLQIPVSYAGINLATRPAIERAHALGLQIDYWVVNDPAQAEHLLDLGADGIVTDQPGRIAEVYARHVRTRAWRARRAAAAKSDATATHVQVARRSSWSACR
jgi:glycerophosphoryl diester phosphodiesterase